MLEHNLLNFFDMLRAFFAFWIIQRYDKIALRDKISPFFYQVPWSQQIT